MSPLSCASRGGSDIVTIIAQWLKGLYGIPVGPHYSAPSALDGEEDRREEQWRTRWCLDALHGVHGWHEEQ